MSLVFATASQLAQMIRDKEVSAIEVLDAYLEQINKHNSKLNAIATLNAEKARTRAIKADEALARGENWGVLHGVPITVKDTFETANYRRLQAFSKLYSPTRCHGNSSFTPSRGNYFGQKQFGGNGKRFSKY